MRTQRTLAETFERPRRPEPMTIAFDYKVDPLKREMHQRAGMLDAFVRNVKYEACLELAEKILERIQFFSEQDILYGTETLRLELTINDRGSYQNWLPKERAFGVRAGAEATIKALPYGMNPNEQEIL